MKQVIFKFFFKPSLVRGQGGGMDVRPGELRLFTMKFFQLFNVVTTVLSEQFQPNLSILRPAAWEY